MRLIQDIREKVDKRLKTAGTDYLRFRSMPIQDGWALFEGGQGKNINGNMFALVREARRLPALSHLQCAYVVTDKTLAPARELFASYGIEGITLVVRESSEYLEWLGRAKYLFTDNSFPVYFSKRTEQVYLNTWHGTPLKQLGARNIRNSIVSFGNVQKNFMAADYVLFPNEHTKECFWDDYKLAPLCRGRYVYSDYPRNDALTNREVAQRVRREQDLVGKRVYAYMPTWRGTYRMAENDEHLSAITTMLETLDRALDDDTLLYVNLHFLMDNRIDFSRYRRIRRFPKAYETYDFLSACDALITDYSSVFFDFAVTRRPIVLFAYDKDEYMSSVGTYMPYEELPFPIVQTTDELVACLSHLDEAKPYEAFSERFCAYHTGTSAKDLLGLVCLGETHPGVHENEEAREVRLHLVDNLSNVYLREAVREELAGEWGGSDVLAFTGRAYVANAEFLESLPEGTLFMSIPVGSTLTWREKVAYKLSRHSTLAARLFRSTLQRAYARECQRLLPEVRVRSIRALQPSGSYCMSVLGAEECTKLALFHGPLIGNLETHTALRGAMLLGDYELQHLPALDATSLDEDQRGEYYSRSLSARVLLKHASQSADRVVLGGLLLAAIDPALDSDRLSLFVDGLGRVGAVTSVATVGLRRLLRFHACIPKDDALELPVDNPLLLRYEEGDLGGETTIYFNVRDWHRSRLRFSGIFPDEHRETTFYFRQGPRNRLLLSVRALNHTDYPIERAKLRVARLLAKVMPSSKAIVVFEKDSSRYEESGSVVFEELIKRGYGAYFILDDTCPQREQIDPRFARNIVSRFSLKHYRLFFGARTFIGSEMPAHAMEIKASVKSVLRRVNDPTLNYVFLQHGVMYMVSLDSESRTFFKPPKKTSGKYRVVTSSEAEKDHFVQLGKHEEDTLYVCGLPKFDRNQWSASADKIAIMPTWRPWEHNVIRKDFKESGYYHLLEDIVESIPEDLREHVLVLPHPLFLKYVKDEDFPLQEYLAPDMPYDQILRDVKLLITDYSSIAYDAFYRGANVIFYWKDLEECMENYGPTTQLMIDERSAPGDVCRTREQLSDAISRRYATGQADEYVKRYRRIVAFHDGHNTDRLIDLMKADGII